MKKNININSEVNQQEYFYYVIYISYLFNENSIISIHNLHLIKNKNTYFGFTLSTISPSKH
ncbi:hypothetical protein D018_1849 [Vibrio parahaemolyticus VP2007-007]|nr:hypothetical protein D018_1849 [Vibrio parahaemolyticus VP2007-007]